MAEQVTTIKDKPSSVEVSQNGKGDYSFSCKIYFNEEEETGIEIGTRIKKIYEYLHENFKS